MKNGVLLKLAILSIVFGTPLSVQSDESTITVEDKYTFACRERADALDVLSELRFFRFSDYLKTLEHKVAEGKCVKFEVGKRLVLADSFSFGPLSKVSAESLVSDIDDNKQPGTLSHTDEDWYASLKGLIDMRISYISRDIVRCSTQSWSQLDKIFENNKQKKKCLREISAGYIYLDVCDPLRDYLDVSIRGLERRRILDSGDQFFLDLERTSECQKWVILSSMRFGRIDIDKLFKEIDMDESYKSVRLAKAELAKIMTALQESDKRSDIYRDSINQIRAIQALLDNYLVGLEQIRDFFLAFSGTNNQNLSHSDHRPSWWQRLKLFLGSDSANETSAIEKTDNSVSSERDFLGDSLVFNEIKAELEQFMQEKELLVGSDWEYLSKIENYESDLIERLHDLRFQLSANKSSLTSCINNVNALELIKKKFNLMFDYIRVRTSNDIMSAGRNARKSLQREDPSDIAQMKRGEFEKSEEFEQRLAIAKEEKAVKAAKEKEFEREQLEIVLDAVDIIDQAQAAVFHEIDQVDATLRSVRCCLEDEAGEPFSLGDYDADREIFLLSIQLPQSELIPQCEAFVNDEHAKIDKCSIFVRVPIGIAKEFQSSFDDASVCSTIDSDGHWNVSDAVISSPHEDTPFELEFGIHYHIPFSTHIDTARAFLKWGESFDKTAFSKKCKEIFKSKSFSEINIPPHHRLDTDYSIKLDSGAYHLSGSRYVDKLSCRAVGKYVITPE